MRRTLSVLGGLSLGLALSQFPEYAQQYEQRLGGAVDELRTITEDFDHAAAGAGLTRDQALGRYASTGDNFITGRGLSLQQTIVRYEKLNADLALIRNAGPLDRALLLPHFLDSDIGARAFEDFKPGLPVTFEGLAWGGFGFILGYGALMALLRLILLPFRWRRGQTPGPVRVVRRA